MFGIGGLMGGGGGGYSASSSATSSADGEQNSAGNFGDINFGAGAGAGGLWPLVVAGAALVLGLFYFNR